MCNFLRTDFYVIGWHFHLMLKYHQGSFYIWLHCLDSNLHCIYLQMKCLLYILCFGSVTSDVISLPGQDNEYYQTSSWSDTQTGLQRSSILTSRQSESCWYNFQLDYNTTVPEVGMWYKQPFSNGPWPFTPILIIQKCEVSAGDMYPFSMLKKSHKWVSESMNVKMLKL